MVVFRFIMGFIVAVTLIIATILAAVMIVEIMLIGVDLLFEAMLTGEFIGALIRSLELNKLVEKSNRIKAKKESI